MKRGRDLSQQERSLWQRTTRDVRPIKKALREEASGAPTTPNAIAPVSEKTLLTSSAGKNIAPGTKAEDLFRTGDPKSIKRIARGAQPIDATLDLHGHTQRTAFMVFRQFLLNASLMKNRNLLIITGKGRRSAIPLNHDGGGVLRQRVREWVQEPEIRPFIARIADAHPRHGGSGALYIVLKNRS